MADLIEEGAVTFDAGGVFYNPRMKLNRDIGVAMTKSLGISEYLDGLASSGVRGLRVASEAGVARVILNDVNPVACERIISNIDRNDLTGCQVSCCNANVLMHQRHFQAVDLDPFGSPSPFISSAARSALAYLFITATDTAPLCGAHLQSGIRKYMAVPLKTDYHREMGARILLGLAARELARLDKAMAPMLTHVTEHYVRTYLRVEQGAKLADDCLKKMGYILHCHVCGSFSAVPVPVSGACGACGGRTIIAGPLWLGPLQDSEVIARAIPEVGQNAPARKLLETCRDEIDVPMYYDHHRLCKMLGSTPVKVDSIVESLRELGFKASRTHFTGIGIKTDACLEDIKNILK